MRSMHSVVGTALLAALCAAAEPAGATITATATISSFRIDLIDLDPNDGVTPGISIPFFGPTHASAIATDSNRLA